MKSKLLIGAIILVLSACLNNEEVVNPYDQFVKDLQVIDDYLAANPTPGATIVKDATGVTLVITERGTGVPPNSGNNLKIDYIGRVLSDGAPGPVFDQRDDALGFKLSSAIIDGWKAGLSLMNEGTRCKLYIPSGLAYGTEGSGSTIPKNAVLVFDMFLETISNTTGQDAQLAADIHDIDVELEGAGAVEDPSGVRIVHTVVGSADPSPDLYSQVRVKYSGKLLANDVEFQPIVEKLPVANFSSRTINYLHGLSIALQQMHPGGKATVYIPSTLGFGPAAITGVPANSNLVVEVELLEVIN